MRLLCGSTRHPVPPAMQPFKALIALTSVTVCLVPYTDGFVALRSLSVPSGTGTHVSSSISTRTTHSSGYTSRPSRPHGVLMATKGKKRKRRKDGPKDGTSTPPSAPTNAKPQPESSSSSSSSSGGSATSSPDSTAVEASQIGDVLEGDKGIEALFSDDWSDMPANDGMIKSNVALPDITKFKPTKRAETTLEQREKKTAVGLTIGKDADEDKTPASLTGFQSKLPPMVDREEERLAKSAAERFDEGPVVKGLKTATWFSICTLVLWEVYINSPWFHTPESPIM